MRRYPCAGPVLCAFLLVAAAPALAAQASPLSLDVRGGIGLPVGSFGRAMPGGGQRQAEASFGIHFDYRTGRRTSVHLGFSQHRIGCAELGCPGEGEYVHTGWDAGTRFDLLAGPVRPRLRVGAVFARVERDFAEAGTVERRLSDLSVGAEAGVELAVRVGPRIHVAPAVRYLWLNTRFPGEGLLRMRYVVTDIALILGF